MPGPVGFRGGSDSISSIQGGAESLLGGGEVRPFSPGYDPSVDPGAGLWRDPNAATESDSPFGLDDACEDGAPDPEFDQGGEFALDDQWKEVAPTGGTGDHRDLTHRNDANQHTGDAINVTTTFPGDGSASTKTLTDAMAAVIAAVSDGATEVYIPRYIVGQVHETTANLYVNNAVEPVTDGLTIADADGLLVLLIDGYDTAVTTDLAGAPGSLTAPAPDGLYVTNASTDDDGSQGVIFIVKDGKANRAAPPYPTVGARYIEPFLAFEFGPITDAIWEMAPPGVLFWCQAGGGGEGRMTRGFYRTDGTSTVVRDESYDVDAPFTVIHVIQGVYEDVSDLVGQQPYRGTSLLWVFSDWNATKAMPVYHVGTTAGLVSVDYEPENYTLSGGDGGNSVGGHLAGIDNAIGEQFLDSVYVPTSGPLVDLATGMELEVETPEVLTLTGNTVHVRSVDQDHTGKTILVECTLVDQHDRSGRRLKGFEMVGTASDAYSFALTLHFASLTPLDGSAWQGGRREDIGIYIGFSGKAVAGLHTYGGFPGSLAAQFTSPIPSNDLDDHRISIIVTTGLNPTFNGVIETEFEIVPVWEDANEAYTPAEASQWEDLTGDVPESKTEALDKLMAAVSTAAADATAKANAAQAFAIQRANHTGTQLLATISDAGNAASRNVGTGSGDVAAGDAPAAAQAAAVQRSNHTGTQLLSTISDAGSAASRNVGTTSTTVAAGDAPAAAQAAAVAAASTDATTKANAAQAAAIAAAATDATTKADAKVADAINDGTTTVAPSQNAVFDALALKIANPGGSNDDFLQRKAGVYTNRTIAQVKTDLGVVAPALTLIASAVLGADAASFSFTSIPGTYNHLVLRFVLRQTTAGVSNRQIHLRFNNDSSSIYDTQQLVGNNSSASAAAFSAANVAILGYSPAATATANYASAGVIEIPGYALTTFFKHGTCQTGQDTNGAPSNFRSDATSFVWRSTAAITRIDLLPQHDNFLAGSAAYLYGVT